LGWIGTGMILFLVPFGIGLAAGVIAAQAAASAAQAGAEAAPTLTPYWVVAPVVIGLLAGLVLWLVVWAPYKAAAMNRIASLLSLDGAKFKLQAKTFSLLWVTLAGWIITIFSLGLLAPLGGFLQIRYILNRLEIIGEPRFVEIGQAVTESPRAGESLGDAFDLDMGVGVI
jgi:uncharacterized membrane protein YjgN (DUF898 family)